MGKGLVQDVERRWWALLRRFSKHVDTTSNVDFYTIKLGKKERGPVLRVTSSYIQHFLLSEYFQIVDQLAKLDKSCDRLKDDGQPPGISVAQLAFSQTGSLVRSVDVFELHEGGREIQLTLCLAQTFDGSFETIGDSMRGSTAKHYGCFV